MPPARTRRRPRARRRRRRRSSGSSRRRTRPPPRRKPARAGCRLEPPGARQAPPTDSQSPRRPRQPYPCSFRLPNPCCSLSCSAGVKCVPTANFGNLLWAPGRGETRGGYHDHSTCAVRVDPGPLTGRVRRRPPCLVPVERPRVAENRFGAKPSPTPGGERAPSGLSENKRGGAAANQDGLLVNLEHCKYECLRKVTAENGFEEVGDDEQYWDLCWMDSSVSEGGSRSSTRSSESTTSPACWRSAARRRSPGTSGGCRPRTRASTRSRRRRGTTPRSSTSFGSTQGPTPTPCTSSSRARVPWAGASTSHPASPA